MIIGSHFRWCLFIFSHLSLVVSSHADIFGLICVGFKVSISLLTGLLSLVCGAERIRKCIWQWSVSSLTVFRGTVSLVNSSSVYYPEYPAPTKCCFFFLHAILWVLQNYFHLHFIGVDRGGWMPLVGSEKTVPHQLPYSIACSLKHLWSINLSIFRHHLLALGVAVDILGCTGTVSQRAAVLHKLILLAQALKEHAHDLYSFSAVMKALEMPQVV